MISITALSKTFAGPNGSAIAALGPLELAIADGEFVCIVGPSGCGKSTLLRLIAGLEAPTSGTAAVTPAPAVTPSLVFQGDSTFPWMTVNENVGYGLRVRGEPDRQRDATVARMLTLVGLTPFAEAYPYQLSGGMKQRVAIARALANDADTLLMDEP
ncbi:MAG TPA: ATP-binding cassette domain-containing protein, partial [Thermoflexales bacterium]|nr:ATP-binding cassette domain-containing protein [Thermoflexales bacterium]